MECSLTRRIIGFCLVLGCLGPASPAVAARACRFPDDVGPRSSPQGAPRQTRFLADVRAGAHRCFDRVTFEFRPPAPGGVGYSLRYEAEPLREDGSGRPVDAEGRAFIVVRLTPARDVEFSGGRAEPTYRGPEAISPRGGTRIVEARHISSFEGTVKWAVGVDRRRPFRVVTLADPLRVVVDVG